MVPLGGPLRGHERPLRNDRSVNVTAAGLTKNRNVARGEIGQTATVAPEDAELRLICAPGKQLRHRKGAVWAQGLIKLNRHGSKDSPAGWNGSFAAAVLTPQSFRGGDSTLIASQIVYKRLGGTRTREGHGA
jgi:hypothetical protein